MGIVQVGKDDAVVALSHIVYSSIGFRKSNPPQNGQVVVYYYNSKHEVVGFVGELTF